MYNNTSETRGVFSGRAFPDGIGMPVFQHKQKQARKAGNTQTPTGVNKADSSAGEANSKKTMMLTRLQVAATLAVKWLAKAAGNGASMRSMLSARQAPLRNGRPRLLHPPPASLRPRRPALPPLLPPPPPHGVGAAVDFLLRGVPAVKKRCRGRRCGKTSTQCFDDAANNRPRSAPPTVLLRLRLQPADAVGG